MLQLDKVKQAYYLYIINHQAIMHIVKRATVKDIDTLIRLRLDYLVMDKGRLSLEEEEAIRSHLQAYFPKHIQTGDFIATIAWLDEKPIAAAFLTIQERPANPSFLTGLTATLINVITYPDYRKRGITTQVVNVLIDEAKKLNVSSIDLAATKDGVGVYKRLGFVEPPYTAMRLKL